jgi:hypothetical protein
MYELTMAQEEFKNIATFYEALKLMLKKTEEMLAGQLSVMIVEQAIWIKAEELPPLMFYDARDFGYIIGYMWDGEIVVDPPKYSEQLVLYAMKEYFLVPEALKEDTVRKILRTAK